MTVTFLKRNPFQRLLGLCATKQPADAGGWRYEDGALVLDLERLPELAAHGSALRFEGGELPARVLVIRDESGAYHAFRNVCTHGKRRLDFVPGTETVQCCSVGKSTFGLDGSIVHGQPKGPIEVFEVEEAEGRLIVRLP